MKKTVQKSGVEAKKIIKRAINKIVDVIAPTLGPAGKSVLLPRTYNRGQRVVDDGYYAAENIQLPDPHEYLAAEFFKEAITKTNSLAGDGTTGTAVVGRALLNSVFRELSDVDIPIVLAGGGVDSRNKSVKQIRGELTETKKEVIEKIKSVSKKIETLDELKQVARISIGKEDSVMADKVAEIVWDIGRDAEGNYVDNHIDITDGFKGEIEFEKSIGMKFPAKISAKAFVNKPERHEMVADDVPTLITNYKLDNPHIIANILQTAKVGKIAIFAPEFSNGVLLYLVQVSQKGLPCFPIKCPALRTEQMQDLAIYTASNFINKDLGAKLENIQAGDLGFAEKIIVKDTENREDATLLGGRGATIRRSEGNMIDKQIDILRGQLAECRNDIEKISIQRRIANLGSAIGTIRVGSSTSGDQLFVKMKIEDGVYACKAALEEGIVRGGGLCLRDIAESLEDGNLLKEALIAPYEQIQKNAGGIEIGEDVFDPAKVVRMIVEHSVSVVSTLITTDSIIAEVPDKSPAEGYEDIARAISKYAYFWARREGMIKENEDLMEEDREREFERIMMTDKG